jgi:hypothetical protein
MSGAAAEAPVEEDTDLDDEGGRGGKDEAREWTGSSMIVANTGMAPAF